MNRIRCRVVRSLELSRLALALFASACGCAEIGTDSLCTNSSADTLINGATVESYVGLSAAQIRAIVRIDDEHPNGPSCSGTLVRRDWVLTARHCLRISSARVRLPAYPELGSTWFSVIGSIGHPEADIALLQLDTSMAEVAMAGVQPISTTAPGAVALGVGDAVELAGYGLTETGMAGELRFLVEPVVEVGEATLRVSGFGASGACDGDSGGPLLTRASDGSAVVAGVLSRGSASCFGEDVYVRTDTLRSWAEASAGLVPPSPRDCGGISGQGRCFHGAALWCAGTELRGEPCVGGKACGWDTERRAFRCVEPFADPCGGVDGLGVCRGAIASWCNHGARQEERCTFCDGVCGYDGRTGRARCRQRAGLDQLRQLVDAEKGEVTSYSR
jgi:Trypsin